MLRNYLLVAVRNLLRNPAISFIPLTGFGLGIAAFLFAVQTITFEYSFDKFHKNVDRIYQVTSDVTLQNGEILVLGEWRRARLSAVIEGCHTGNHLCCPVHSTTSAGALLRSDIR